MPMGAAAGGEMDPRMAQLKRQQKMADMLRGNAMSMQNRGPGVAPMLQQIMSGVMAGKMDRDNDAMTGQMGREQAGARAQNMDQLIMALRSRIPPESQRHRRSFSFQARIGASGWHLRRHTHRRAGVSSPRVAIRVVQASCRNWRRGPPT